MKFRFLQHTLLLLTLLTVTHLRAQEEIQITEQPRYTPDCAGNPAAFTVAAIGGNLSYQWYGHTGQAVEALTETGIYSGTNTPTLTLSQVSTEMNLRHFYCKITGNGQEARSSSATIRLKNLLFNAPSKDKTAYVGDNVLLHCDATGENITYQWQRKTEGSFQDLQDFKRIKGTDKANLLLNEVQSTDGAEYRCVVTSSGTCGTQTLTTDPITLTVNTEINPQKSMSLLPAENVLTVTDEIIYFRNDAEMEVWGSIQVNGNGQFGSFTETGQAPANMNVTGSLENNNTANELFQEDDRTRVTFEGDTDEIISGNSFANNFYNLNINKGNGAQLSLENNPTGSNAAASVAFDLTFQSGNLNLKNNNLELLPFNSQTLALLDPSNAFAIMPFIQNETESSRIVADAGEVFMEVQVASTNPIDQGGYNMGNMGLRLEGLQDGTSLFSSDFLTIRRGHQINPIGSGSIDRYYKLTTGVTSNEVSLSMNYFPAELNGNDPDALDFYHSEDFAGGLAWTNQGADSPNNGVNSLSLSNPEVLQGLWTLTACESPEVSLSPDNFFEMCSGTPDVTLSANVTAGGPAAVYQWQLGLFDFDLGQIVFTNIPGANGPTYTVDHNNAPGGIAEYYKVIVENAEGCKGEAASSFFHYPQVVVDWSDLPTLQCNLSPFTFDADWGSEFAGYSWTVDGVTQAGSSSTFTFTPPAAGTYEIGVTTGVFAEGAFICPETFTHTMTFNAEDVNVFFPYPLSEVNFCENDGTFELTPEITPPDDGTYTYDWQLNGVTVSNNPTLLLNYNASVGSETYELFVSNSVGCADDALVFVYYIDSPEVDWSALPTTQCTLDPFTFNGDWGNPFAAYEWSVNGELQSGEFNSDFTFIPPAAGTYEISLTTGEFAEGFVCPETFTHTITFSDGQQNADLPFSIAVCDVEGGLTPVDLITPACEGCTYAWFNQAGTPVGSNSNIYTVPDVTANTSYSVEVTKDGCTGSDVVNLFYYFVAIDETATVVTAADCDGEPTGAIDLVYDATEFGYAEFLWENVGTGETYFNEDLSGLAAGTYSVTINDNLNACSDTATFTVGGGSVAIVPGATVEPIDCFGNDNGSIVLNPTGGSGTYTYQWSNSASSNALFNLEEGTYTVTISDGGDCPFVESYTITEPPLLEVNVLGTDLACNGAADGTITLNITGGSLDYNITWSANAGSPADPENLSELSGGSYSVTVTDSRNCEVISGITLEEPASAVTAVFTPTTSGISCNNASDGFIGINAQGGTGDLTYDWNVDTYDGQSSVSNLPAGTYSISVSDANSCPPVVLDITFENPLPLGVTDVSINPSGAGATDGSIDISVSGGTPGYNYDWQDVPGINNPEDRTGLGAGTYTVIITDANDCEFTEQYQLTAPGEIAVILESITDVSCTGTDDGAIDVTIAGGVMPYTFLWSNGAESEDINNLPAGDYTLTVTDANNIEFTSLTYTVNPPVFLTDNASITQIACAGETGTIVLNPTGGTSAYTYAWSNAETTATISDLQPGDYTVTISTENDCPFTATYTINPAPAAIVISEVITGTCEGTIAGAVDVSVSGGTPDFSYNWVETGSNTSIANTEDLSSFAAGNYTLIITDANACESAFDFVIPEYPEVAATGEVSNVTVNGASDGIIDLTVNSGTPDYTFSWSNADGFSADTEDVSELSVGTYEVLITDANGCSFTTAFSVNEPGALDLAVSILSEIQCNGDETGSIQANINGGTEPFTFAWSNGGSTNPLTDLPAGTYTLTVTDGAGAMTISTPITLTEPAPFSISASVQNPSDVGTTDGSIITNPQGGTEPYVFLWSDGTNTYNSSSLSNLGAGTYSLTVSDANDCPAIDAAESYTLSDPSVLVLSLDNQQNITCPDGADGSLTVSVSGGEEAYTFNWENTTEPGLSIGSAATLNELEAGTYAVTATDANDLMVTGEFTLSQPAAFVFDETVTNVLCDEENSGSIVLNPEGGTAAYSFLWSNSATAASIENLSAGTYSVTVTDAVECTYENTFTVLPASVITVEETIENVDCNDSNSGSISLNPQGGGGSYDFLWSNSGTGASVSNLTAGAYTVTITDGGDCDFIETYTVEEPTALSAVLSPTQASQPTVADGSIDLTVTGGTEQYSFQWSNDATTEDLENILPGTYTVTITDMNNCELIESVSVSSPGGLAVLPMVNQISCFGLNDGSISLEIEGGTMPFDILWSNEATGPDIDNLAPGIYGVTVSDATDFSVELSVEIIEPAEFSVGLNAVNTSCSDTEDGAVNLSLENGVSPFEFAWSNNAVTQNINSLAAGIYTVTATDDNDCVSVETIEVNSPAPLSLSVDIIENPECAGDANGTIFLSSSGGTGELSFLWSNAATTEDITDLAAGEYTLTLSDENNCTTEMTYEVIVPQALSVTFDVQNISCGESGTGSVTANVIGGTSASGDYTFTWSNGGEEASISDLSAGIYNLTISDDNDCTIFSSAEVTQSGSLTVAGMQQNISCFGEADGILTVEAEGGTEPYDFLWSTGAETNTIAGLGAQDYSVTITDAEGCEGTATYFIIQPTPLDADFSIDDALCFDSADGAIDLSLSGGTLEDGNAYTYLWSNNAATEDVSGLTAGEYTVTASDDNDCELIETLTVGSPDEIIISSLLSGTDCSSDAGISITLEVSGGTPGYTYVWSTGDTDDTAENLSPGTYSATISDANACMQIFEEEVNSPQPISVEASVQAAGCQTNDDGSIDLTVSGGIAPYTFTWSNGASTEDVNGLTTGDYNVTVVDMSNCEGIESFNVVQADTVFNVNFLVNSGLSDTDTLQVNSSDIVQFIDVSTPTPTSWFWEFGDANNSTGTEQNPQFSYPFDENLEQTEYFPRLIAANEFCRDTMTKTILIINNFRPNLPEFDPGENVRFLSLNAFPNPTDDRIKVEVELNVESDLEIRLVDVLGRTRHREDLTEAKEYSIEISLADYIDGYYYLQLRAADRVEVLGIVKVE